MCVQSETESLPRHSRPRRLTDLSTKFLYFFYTRALKLGNYGFDRRALKNVSFFNHPLDSGCRKTVIGFNKDMLVVFFPQYWHTISTRQKCSDISNTHIDSVAENFCGVYADIFFLNRLKTAQKSRNNGLLLKTWNFHTYSRVSYEFHRFSNNFELNMEFLKFDGFFYVLCLVKILIFRKNRKFNPSIDNTLICTS